MNIAADIRHEDLVLQLSQGLVKLGLALNSKQSEWLMLYITLIEKWNRVYNITAITETKKIISTHLLDSLSIMPYITGTQILDVGTGAGLPGIPVAIANSERKVTLLDSNQKKAAFLRHSIAELGLRNVEVVCERVESWRPARKFDFIISRAFSELAQFVELAGHLLSSNGVLAAMKGVEPVEEMRHLPSGFRVKQVFPILVPGLDAKRHLILIGRV